MGGAPSKPDFSIKKPLVIGAGYARTGTVSVQIALQKLLNGPVLHAGTHVMAREDSYCKKWGQALEARRLGDRERMFKLLREVTTGYIAIVDIPVVLFVPELTELYPDAKVILMTRDPDNWWVSMSGLLESAAAWYVPYVAMIQPGLRWFPDMYYEWRKICDQMVNPDENGNYGPELIQAHNMLVMDTVPKDKLLVSSVKEGWEPMCKFLGKPVPDESFPWENDAVARDKAAGKILVRVMLKWLGLFATVGGVTYWGSRLLRKP